MHPEYRTPVFIDSPYVLRQDASLERADGEPVAFPQGTVFKTGPNVGEPMIPLVARLSPKGNTLTPQVTVRVMRNQVMQLFTYDAHHGLILASEEQGGGNVSIRQFRKVSKKGEEE